MNIDPDCIFCKVAAGDIPSAKILEDEAALAFMDIGPVAPGHVLLIPRPHWSTVDQMPPDALAATMRHLPALVGAVRSATGCEGVNVLQNNGRLAGQVVDHVHFHVIPRSPGGAFTFNWPAGEYPEGRMEQLADAIRGCL